MKNHEVFFEGMKITKLGWAVGHTGPLLCSRVLVWACNFGLNPSVTEDCPFSHPMSFSHTIIEF